MEDEREAQVFLDFDRLFKELQSKALQYGLVQPPLFNCPQPHSCFTEFHKNAEEGTEETEEEMEKKMCEATVKFIDHLLETENLHTLTEKTLKDVKGKGHVLY